MNDTTVISLQTARSDEPVLHLDLDGFEGPIDVLLMLARAQKVDLREVSILALVEQYLSFIQSAADMRLELAAEYMVMAAWLTYLKTRLLLPKEDDDEEPSAEELALRLQLQLQRLEAMRNVGLQLVARDQLGRDVLTRGMPEGLKRIKKTRYDATLYELLKAYAQFRTRGQDAPFTPERPAVLRLEEAFERLSALMGVAVEWTRLEAFMPELGEGKGSRASHLASTFAASLELVKQGGANLQQSAAFGPVFLKSAAAKDAGE
ncbi:MAG: ScpA family protein [Pseudomonadota bacterium]